MRAGHWWRWDYHADPQHGNVTLTVFVSWARPCHGFRLLHDAGDGRLLEHASDAVMLPLLSPKPGLRVRNERRVPAIPPLEARSKPSFGHCPLWLQLTCDRV